MKFLKMLHLPNSPALDFKLWADILVRADVSYMTIYMSLVVVDLFVVVFFIDTVRTKH